MACNQRRYQLAAVCLRVLLGPLLFIFTMNDIGNVSEFLYTILYADDTCVLHNGKDYLNLIASLNSELDQ